MTITYEPRPVPDRKKDDHDDRDLRKFISEEFRRISDNLREIGGIMLPELNVSPKKPRDGMIIYADGSNFDPGAGSGFYGRDDGVWVPLFVTSGTYTPTLFNNVNIASSQAFVCPYARLGNFVIVSGRVDIDPTAGSVGSELGVSIPIPSNFTVSNQAGGAANCASSPSLSAGIYSDAANNRVGIQWTHTADTANRDWYFIFGYTVLP